MRGHRSVLAIGAHPDDIELGCGGTIARHVAVGDQVAMLVVTRGEVGPGEVLQRVEEQRRAAEVLGVSTLLWGNDIPDCQVSLHELGSRPPDRGSHQGRRRDDRLHPFAE